MTSLDNPTATPVPPGEKLSFWTKIAYAFGGLGNAVGSGTIIPFWYTFFLTDIARLDLGLVSLFWVIVITWDALSNPLVGYLSDRTRTRWGRRRPYLLFGAVPFGLFFMLLWWIPPTQSQALLFAYYLVVYLIFETAATLVTCPYAALTPELTRDHDERTSLMMVQMVVTILAGVVVPVLFSFLVLPLFPDRDPRAYQLLALICGVCFTAASLLTFFVTRERPNFQEKKGLSPQEVARFVLKNVPFRYTLAIHVLGWMPVTVATSLFAYYFIYWVGMGLEEVSLVQGGIMLMAWLLLPVVFWLSRRFEKKTAYILAAGSWAVLMLSTLWIPQGAKIPAYIICALSGFGVSAVHLLPSSMLPDVIEVDELVSGHRQEGAYAGVTAFGGKLGQMLILALLPAILRWSGYVQPAAGEVLAEQSPSTLQALRIMIAILPSILLVLSMIAAYFYPITREKHAQLRGQIEDLQRTQGN